MKLLIIILLVWASSPIQAQDCVADAAHWETTSNGKTDADWQWEGTCGGWTHEYKWFVGPHNHFAHTLKPLVCGEKDFVVERQSTFDKWSVAEEVLQDEFGEDVACFVTLTATYTALNETKIHLLVRLNASSIPGHPEPCPDICEDTFEALLIPRK